MEQTKNTHGHKLEQRKVILFWNAEAKTKEHLFMSEREAQVYFYNHLTWFLKKSREKFFGKLEDEDLLQEFRIVLHKVYRAYDPNRGACFWTLLHRSLCNKSSQIRYSVGLAEKKLVDTISIHTPIGGEDTNTFEDVLAADPKELISETHVNLGRFFEDFDEKFRSTQKHVVRIKSMVNLLSYGFSQNDITKMIRVYQLYKQGKYKPSIFNSEFVFNVRTGQRFRIKNTETKKLYFTLEPHGYISFFDRTYVFPIRDLIPDDEMVSILRFNLSQDLETIGDLKSVGELIKRIKSKYNTYMKMTEHDTGRSLKSKKFRDSLEKSWQKTKTLISEKV